MGVIRAVKTPDSWHSIGDVSSCSMYHRPGTKSTKVKHRSKYGTKRESGNRGSVRLP
jgi:hypothetical protein